MTFLQYSAKLKTYFFFERVIEMMHGVLVVTGFLSIVLVFVSFMGVSEIRNRPRLKALARIALPVSSLVSIASGISVCVYGYHPGVNEVGVRLDGSGNYSEFTAPTMCWQRNCILVAKNAEVEGAVQPITDNPKVRHLKYKIEVAIVDPVAFARTVQLQPGASCPGQGPMKCQLNDAVLYEIYEFNNANSKELAKFYNPYDKRQTQEIEKLMHQKLNAPLTAKGIDFRRLMSWSVE